MKTLYTCLLCAAGMQLIIAGVCNAQAPAPVLKAAPATVSIDGLNREWGDSLSFYNADRKLHYHLSNDKDNLYLVVKAKDVVQESNILVAGLTFTIDTKGRKKNSYSVKFPSNGENPPLTVSKMGAESLDQKATQAKFLKFKKIEVDGFKDIDDKYITTTNTFGIKAAIDYDDQGYLIYEEVIPLALFHAGDLAKGEWAYNIKLNSIEQPAKPASNDFSSIPSGGGKGGKGNKSQVVSDPSMAFAGTGPLTPTIDFWGKFSLAK